MATAPSTKFLQAIRKQGYRPLSWPLVYTDKGGWHALETTKPEAKVILHLSYKPQGGTFGVRAGVFNALATVLFRKSLGVVADYERMRARPEEGDYIYMVLSWLCRSRSYDSSEREIPDRKHKENWESDFKAFEGEIIGEFLPLKDACDIADYLLKGTWFFDTSISNLFVRVAYITSLLTVAGVGARDIPLRIQAALEAFAAPYHDVPKLMAMTDQLVAFLAHEHQRYPSAPQDLDFFA